MSDEQQPGGSFEIPDPNDPTGKTMIKVPAGNLQVSGAVTELPSPSQVYGGGFSPAGNNAPSAYDGSDLVRHPSFGADVAGAVAVEAAPGNGMAKKGKKKKKKKAPQGRDINDEEL